jgi:hypothetical protein
MADKRLTGDAIEPMLTSPSDEAPRLAGQPWARKYRTRDRPVLPVEA